MHRLNSSIAWRSFLVRSNVIGFTDETLGKHELCNKNCCIVLTRLPNSIIFFRLCIYVCVWPCVCMNLHFDIVSHYFTPKRFPMFTQAIICATHFMICIPCSPCYFENFPYYQCHLCNK